jgi:hypothetical protein
MGCTDAQTGFWAGRVLTGPTPAGPIYPSTTSSTVEVKSTRLDVFLLLKLDITRTVPSIYCHR